MICDDVLLSLMARRDGEEAPLSAEAVDAHLHGCPACQAEAAADGALDARLKAARPAPLPARNGGILVAAAALVLLLRTGLLVQLPAAAWAGSLGAVALIALAFVMARENPLRLHPRPE